jgi:hypothetical protein
VSVLHTPLSVRVHVVRAGRKPVQADDERQDHPVTVRGFRTAPMIERLLVVRMLEEEEGAREWSGGLFRISQRREDGSYGPAHPVQLLEPTAGVIPPVRVSRTDRGTIRRWAQSHGLPLVSMQEFVHRVLFLEGHRGPTTICTYDPAVVLSSLARFWSAGRNGRGEGFILTLCPHHRGHKGCPRIAVIPMTPPGVRIEFTKVWGDAAPVYGPHTPGRFYSVRGAVFALTNEDLDLREACRVFGITLPEHPRSASLADRLETCLAELDAMCALAEVTMPELLRHESVVSGGNELDRAREKKVSVGAVQSSGTLAKGYLRAAEIGTPPPLHVTPDLGMTVDDVHGACMGSFYPGRMEVLVRHEPVPSAVCDVRAEYPAVFTLLGLGELLTAEYVEAYDAMAEAKVFLSTVTPMDMLRPETWRGLRIVCLVRPDRDFLPARIPYANRQGATDTGEREVVWGQLTLPAACDPVWYALGDLWISQENTGQPIGDRIIRTIGFRPVGRRNGLRPVLYGGIAPVTDPAQFVKAMVEARPELEAQGLAHLAEGAKVQANTAAFGIWAEVHRHDLSSRSRVRVWVYDGLRRRLMRARPLVEERPGPFYFPAFATLVTAGGRVMLYLIEHFTREAGGDIAMLAVDSAAIIPTGRAPDPIATCRGVAERLEPLNPWTMKPFLRLDKAHEVPPRPLAFFGITTSRYCLFSKEGRGHRYRALDPSGQVLGQYEDPFGGEVITVGGETFPRFWAEAWEWMIRHARTHRDTRDPDWVHCPAVFLAGWTHPKQGFFSTLPRSEARPFCVARVVHDNFSDAVAIGTLTRSGKLVWRRYPGGQRVEVRTRTGSHLDFLIPAGGPRVIIPRTWASVLRHHLHTPNHKFANGDRQGSLERWEIVATEIDYVGKEGPVAVGQASAHSMAWEDVEGAVRAVYEPVDYPAEEIARARAVLDGVPRSLAAFLIGLHPRKLQDFIHGRSTPRPPRLRRCLLLARLWASGGHDESRLHESLGGAAPTVLRRHPLDQD